MIFIVMKVTLKNVKKYYTFNELGVLMEFIKFIEKQIPLIKDITIHFLDVKLDNMTTGATITGNQLYVLAKNRMFIDVLRTLSHEWVHEYQYQILKVSDKIKHQEIGGKLENMSNVLSGIMVKKFQKKYPEYLNILYEI